MTFVRTPQDVVLQHRYNSDDVRSSEVSLGCFLENHLVQCEIGDRPSKPGVLRFEFLETLHLIDPHAALFFPPAVVGDLMNTQFANDLRHLHPLGQQGFRLSQLGDDLFRPVVSSCHFLPPSIGPDTSSVSGPFSGGAGQSYSQRRGRMIPLELWSLRDSNP